MKKINLISVALAVCFTLGIFSAEAGSKKKKEQKNDTINSSVVSGLSFRSIGPAFTSGRIADFAVNPKNHSEWFVAVASGHIWKTNNNGTTFSPVFDNYGSYSIGCLAIDPGNTNVIWAGTGENNHQRALGYGDGVYKSVDGGSSWNNMGLKESRHIGMIAIDPQNSDIVYVAAEGSAWGSGGDRGLYKTIDGGKSWEKVLEVSEHTGANNVILDPRNTDVIYVTTEQRRRHVHTKIGGGPESSVYKSEDGGKKFRKITKGLPGVDKGGMGIAISPVNPDVLYLIIEAAENKGGFYRSVNRGESWSKMSDHTASGQYYNEIYCDPTDVDKVYSVETYSHYTEDGGKTWKRLSNNKRHVDDHALWIDPADTQHLLIGGDGGAYESFDGGANYIFKSNLPVTQFYRVAVDNDYPFYNVYGGTQDNNSYGGPNQNTNSDGVEVGEWKVTLGGDGFWQAIDAENPDIVYSEYQYGNVYRYDKKSGERLNIKPQPRKGEETYKWNWNAPMVLSKHQNARLYIAANKVFCSDDRGNSWKVISEDLTTGVDRNTWPVMGRFWSNEAVQKDVSTSLFGTIVSIVESPLKENLLYIGTDDGLIQRTDDGKKWEKISAFPNVPEYTYISDIWADRFDENLVYAAFDNRKRDDFKPYLLKSVDKGRTWVSIVNNLPENGTVHTIIQDHFNKELLFVGTEFGVFFSINGGEIWTQLKSGIPTIAVRDIAIQERENDLVLATFGRGFYILDDYSPLRVISPEILEQEAYIFPIKDALMYVQTSAKGSQGATVYLGDNPDFGATFSYFVKEVPKTLKQKRKEIEKNLIKDKKPIPQPTLDQLRAEEQEVSPYLIFTITDESGQVVKKLTKTPSEGVNRMNWDLRYASMYPIHQNGDKFDPLKTQSGFFFALPGKYFVDLSLYSAGEFKQLVKAQPFVCKTLNNTTLPGDNAARVAFQKNVNEMGGVIWGTFNFKEDIDKRVLTLKQLAHQTPGVPLELMHTIVNIEKSLSDIQWKLFGREPKASREENPPAKVSISERLNSLAWARWASTSDITETEKMVYEILRDEFPSILDELTTIYTVDIPALEAELEKYKVPYSSGRIPVWGKE
ncbi:MAG: hypothetical protein JEZ03_06080 [Bacteroidales bacterium]|nr:hypothetical protein [Bacteroidales bacterium]